MDNKTLNKNSVEIKVYDKHGKEWGRRYDLSRTKWTEEELKFDVKQTIEAFLYQIYQSKEIEME